MSFETPRTTVEIAPELAFASFEAIDDLRTRQELSIYDAQQSAMQTALENGTSVKEARETAGASAETNVGNIVEAFVAPHIDRDEDEHLFEAMVDLIQNFSIDHMDSTTWKLGEDNDFSTSGRYQLEQALLAMSEGEPEAVPDPGDTSPVDHESPEFEAAATALNEARAVFAKLSVDGRQRILGGGKKATEFADKLKAAHDEYEAAKNAIVDMYINGYAAQGRDPQFVFEKTMPWVIKEQTSFQQAEQKYLSEDPSLRARAARFLSKRGGLFGLSVVSGAALGTGARLVSKSALALGVGVTGGAAAGAYLGYRAAKGALLSKVKSSVTLHKDVAKRAAADKATLESHIAGITEKSVEQVRGAVSAIGSIAMNRVEKDRKSNRNKQIIAAALGGATAAVAFELVPEITDLFGHHDTSSGGHTPTNTGGGHDVPPTGGHDTPPTVDNYGYDPHVSVEHGHGYIKEIQDLGDQQGHHLSLAQATDAYHHMLNNQGTGFFTNDANLPHGGDNWISRPGAATWDHAHIASFHHWLQAQEDLKKVA